MKFIKLLPTILKNLSLMIWQYKPARWAMFIIVIAAIGFSGYKIFFSMPDPNNPNLSLSQAAKIGTVTTHKLMVQIEPSKCPEEKSSGCYERGDIVVILPGERDFSDGEKAGFLILNMDLTDKQAEILLHPEQKISAPKEIPEGMKEKDIPPMLETIKIRRYAVDLKKIGIGDDVTTGRVIDKIYKWDVVREK